MQARIKGRGSMKIKNKNYIQNYLDPPHEK
jgi:hypothetical protein